MYIFVTFVDVDIRIRAAMPAVGRAFSLSSRQCIKKSSDYAINSLYLGPSAENIRENALQDSTFRIPELLQLVLTLEGSCS